MSSDDKKNEFIIDSKGIISLLIIVILGFFTISTYVNALLNFQPTAVSQYGGTSNRSPIADAGPDQMAYLDQSVDFSGSGSRDPDGRIMSYRWVFGDGESASGVNVSHIYLSEGIFEVTLKVTDNRGASSSDSCNVTVVSHITGNIEDMNASEAAEYLSMLSPEEAADILFETNTSVAAGIFGEMNSTFAVKVLNTTVFFNQTEWVSRTLLEMEEDMSAALLIEMDTAYSSDVVGYIAGINVTGCARIIEAAVKLDVEGTVTILEGLENEVLLELLVEISVLTTTPSTVAAIFEVMSLDRVLEAVRAWVSIEKLQELGSVFDFLSPETLNRVYGGLTIQDRIAIYPSLSSETISAIGTQLLPIADLTPTLITVTKVDHLGYSVTATVENRGSVESIISTIDLSIDDSLIDEKEIPSLSTEEWTVTYEWRPTTTGAHTLVVRVDPDNLIDELSEDNNELSITYGVELPDLTLSFKEGSMELVEKKPHTIELEVSNIGEENAGAFSLIVEASGVTADARWISSTVGTAEVEQLPPDSNEAFQFSWTPEEAGAYTLEARVDQLDAVLEGDEANNIDVINITITRPGPPWVLIAAVGSVIAITIFVLIIFRNRFLGLFSFFGNLVSRIRRYFRANF